MPDNRASRPVTPSARLGKANCGPGGPRSAIWRMRSWARSGQRGLCCVTAVLRAGHVDGGQSPAQVPRLPEHRQDQHAAARHFSRRAAAAKPTARAGLELTARIRSVARIVIIDVAAPLIAYSVLRSTGMSTVMALVLSGAFPAVGVAVAVIRHRRLEVVGALVLAGILAGTLLGLISHSARLVLMEGSVPTAIFGVGCLGSLWMGRPLMYGFAVEFIGPDTAKGREMISLWRYEGFRRIFRMITAVWGVGFLLEAGLRVAIVYSTSTGTALSLSKVMPYVWVGIFVAWTVTYGRRQRKKGGRMLAAATAAGPGPGHADSQPTDVAKIVRQAPSGGQPRTCAPASARTGSPPVRHAGSRRKAEPSTTLVPHAPERTHRAGGARSYARNQSGEPTSRTRSPGPARARGPCPFAANQEPVPHAPGHPPGPGKGRRRQACYRESVSSISHGCQIGPQ